MTYAVKEIYYTLQGEGVQAGRASVFCRFAGCNLWSGLEQDRKTASCWFCDTDFLGTNGPQGARFASARALASSIHGVWNNSLSSGSSRQTPYLVLTGGEPSLQVDQELIDEVHARGFTVAIETNGTRPLPEGLDWVTVSPKPTAKIVVTKGNELKLVFPHQVHPKMVEYLDFEYFLLSPLTSANPEETSKNLQLAIAYTKLHPKWRLTMQYHKHWGLP